MPSTITNPMPVPINHLFPPGPCEITVGTGDTVRPGGTFHWEFLGTTREGGRAQEVLYTGNIPGDYAGSDGMPAEIRLSGKGIVVVCQMQNFNPFVMKRLKSRFFGNFRGFSKPGQIDSGDIGAMLIQEYRYVPLCIRSLNAYGGNAAKYPDNESGLWVPICFPSGDMGWDYAAREQVYSLTFLGITYMNMAFPATLGAVTDPQNLGVAYNAGVLYSVEDVDIATIWNAVTNPTS